MASAVRTIWTERKKVDTQIIRNKRILLADDTYCTRRITQQRLLNDGHDVVLATSGAEALKLLKSEDFDAVFLDFSLGDMKGTEVFQYYQFDRLDTAPTFFLTADTSDESRALMKKVGASGILYKPSNNTQLRQAIAKVCEDSDDEPAENITQGAEKTQGPEATKQATVYIDQQVIRNLRKVADRAGFVEELLRRAARDIEQDSAMLITSLGDCDPKEVCEKAHQLCNSALAIGAAPLAKSTTKLMHMDPTMIKLTAQNWVVEITQIASKTLAQLEKIVNDPLVGDGEKRSS
jgi:CheY-like chemotaxis protein/HPt (histidine-containing phosphotransfer) domain-containing protein